MRKQNIDEEEQGRILAKGIFLVEKEMGVTITKDYPWLKFLSQREHLAEYAKEQKRASKGKNKSLR